MMGWEWHLLDWVMAALKSRKYDQLTVFRWRPSPRRRRRWRWAACVCWCRLWSWSCRRRWQRWSERWRRWWDRRRCRWLLRSLLPSLPLFAHNHTQSVSTVRLVFSTRIRPFLSRTQNLIYHKILGKNLQNGCHCRLLQKWLKSVELVLLCMFQSNLLMGNCSWLTSGTRVQNMVFTLRTEIRW